MGPRRNRGCQSQRKILILLPSRGQGLAECLRQRTGVLRSGSMPTRILACYRREAKDCWRNTMGPRVVVV
jgi:hypothetical protein